MCAKQFTDSLFPGGKKTTKKQLHTQAGISITSEKEKKLNSGWITDHQHLRACFIMGSVSHESGTFYISPHFKKKKKWGRNSTVKISYVWKKAVTILGF